MIIFLNRLPIPNLRHYCLLSLFLFLLVILYANKVLHDIAYNRFARALPAQQAATTETPPTPPNEPDQPPSAALITAAVATNRSNVTTPAYDFAYMETHGYVLTILKIITSEPWCIWVLINFCYCGLLLFSKVIQGIVFGKLRAVENQHIKDQFWNFIFLKFIFIFGVLNLENMHDLIMWCTWFSIIGWLSIHCQICKDRFEYLSFATSTPMKSHIKVYVLLICIQLLCMGLIVVSFITQRKIGFSFGLFMLAEAFGLTLRTLYVISKYSVHLWDLRQTELWESKGTLTYYIDFSFEMCVVSIDFLHYFHMLIYGNFYLSMASLVICMELKRLFVDLRRRMRRHSNYLRVIEKMEKRFPWANQAELNYSEKCAVCWEKLDKARRLPCSHVFHHNCLRSWLEQDTSCPTCRKSLQDEKPPAPAPAPAPQPEAPAAEAAAPAEQPAPQQPLQRNYFHFEGPRYFSWLPSFSVQVTHNLGQQQPQQQAQQQQQAGGSVASEFLRRANLLLGGASIRSRHAAALDPARLAVMTEQVRQMFPQIPIEVIQADLNRTHSVEVTTEHILDERIDFNPVGNANPHLHQHMQLHQHMHHHPGGGAVDVDDDEVDDEEDIDLDEDDVDEDEEDDEELDDPQAVDDDELMNTSSDDDHHRAQRRHHRAAAQATPRASLLSNILGGGSQPSTSRPQTRSTTAAASSLLDRYVTSPSNSDNTNALIQKKRDLILNSKKRFLERQQTDTPVVVEQQQQSTTSNEASTSQEEDLATSILRQRRSQQQPPQ